jgi:hypothetical protein
MVSSDARERRDEGSFAKSILRVRRIIENSVLEEMVVFFFLVY